MTTFSKAIPDLIRICEDHDSASKIDKFCIVRDIHGRVRLVVEAAENIDLLPLEHELQQQLGRYFVSPILSLSGSTELRRIACSLIEIARDRWPTGWPTERRNFLGVATAINIHQRWIGFERTIGKDAWLSRQTTTKPWPLQHQQPPIVTFHSFKGGVGRTTLVAAYALDLASKGKKVAVLDLDLEAPGIGTLFDLQTDRGVLDILVDHIATGQISTENAFASPSLPARFGDRINVFPAGSFDEVYLSKLARLDFASHTPNSPPPVAAALISLLKKVRANFDCILLDSRAGLHDLAGMSLHGLAHVDVLVFRGTTQNLDGLKPTLRVLKSEDTRILLVETMLPTNELDFASKMSKTRDAIYDLVCTEYYETEGDLPQLLDMGEVHDVVHIRRKEWLDGIDSIASVASNVLSDRELALLFSRVHENILVDAAIPADGDDGTSDLGAVVDREVTDDD